MLKILFALFSLHLISGGMFAELVVVSSFFFLSLAALPLCTVFNAGTSLFLLDGLSVPLILLTLWLTPLFMLASPKFNLVKHSSFLNTLIVLAGVLLVAFSSSSGFLFYIFFEASVIPAGFLILSWGYQPERLPACTYLVLYTVGASLPLLVGLFLMKISNSHLSFMLPMWESPAMVSVSFWWVLVIAPFLVKVPIYSLHLWLPKAHVEAPVAGSMVLAGVLLKLGGFGLIRFFSSFAWQEAFLGAVLSSVAIWGAVLAGLVCLRQPDMKALIAYSSVAHMGFLLAGVFSCGRWGWDGAVVMMLAHGFTSSALFALANVTYGMTGTRSLMLTKGLLVLSPHLAALWFVGLVANLGAPPSINLQAEILLIAATLASFPWISGFLSLALVLSAAYTLHLYSAVNHGRPLISGGGASALPLCSRQKLMIGLHLLPVISLVFKSDQLFFSL